MSAPSVPEEGDVQPAVRVMRLYKPPLRSEPEIRPFQTPNLNIGEYLTLPDNFGEIYFGETFTAYVGVVNDFKNIVFDDVSIRVRLQSATAAHDLVDTRGAYDTDSSNNTSLSAQSRKDMIISHRLLELGAYTMRVTIGYTDTSQQLKTIRKFYRFNVECPLKVTTTCVFNRESRLLTLSGEVRNMTKNNLFLDKMSFSSQQGNLIRLQTPVANTTNTQVNCEADADVEASSSLTSTSLVQGILPSGEIDVDNFEMVPLLAPNEQYAMLFLQDNVTESQLPQVVNTDHPLGTIDIVWRACMCEEAWFSHTVSSITDTTNGGNDSSTKPFVNVICLSHPYEVAVMQPIDVTVCIEGLEQSHLAIVFELDIQTTGITILGTTKHTLILPNGNETHEQCFQLLPTCSGLHHLNYSVKEIQSGRSQSSKLLNILCV